MPIRQEWVSLSEMSFRTRLGQMDVWEGKFLACKAPGLCLCPFHRDHEYLHEPCSMHEESRK